MGVLICERTRDGDQTDRRERQAEKKLAQQSKV
jgi:hypothetical protein